MKLVVAIAAMLVVTLSPAAASPVDTPHGRLAFSSDRPLPGQPHENAGNAEIYSLDVVTGRRRNLSRNVGAHDYAPSPSRDGRWIAYLRGPDVGVGEPWVMRADGSGKRRLARIRASSVRWSPDGASLVIAADGDGGVYVVRRDGTRLRRVLSDRFARDVAWSPDGTLLAALIGERDGDYSDDRLAVMRPDGTDLRPLGPGRGSDSLVTWSRDSREIAFVHFDRDRFVNDVFTATVAGDVRRLTSFEPPFFSAITSLSWAPGGRLLYVVGGRAYGVARGGSAAKLVLRNVVRASWSRDGRRLASARVARPLQIGLTHPGARTVYRHAGDAPGDILDGPSWLGSRRVVYTTIYFGANDRELYAIDGDGRHLRQLTRNTVDDVEPAWSPRGDRIAFTRGRLRYGVLRQGSIWTMRADGSSARRLTGGPLDGGPSWSPDGRRLAFERRGSVAVVGFANPRVRILGRGHDPAWSPKGRLIAFVDTERLAVSVVAPDGSGERTLFRTERHDETGTPIVSSPTWRPDGTAVTFYLLVDHGRWAEERAVTVALDGAVLSESPCYGGHPAWSTDGAWLTCDGITVGRPGSQDVRRLTDGAEPDWRP